MKTNLLKLTCGLALLGAIATARAQSVFDFTYYYPNTNSAPFQENSLIANGIDTFNEIGTANVTATDSTITFTFPGPVILLLPMERPDHHADFSLERFKFSDIGSLDDCQF